MDEATSTTTTTAAYNDTNGSNITFTTTPIPTTKKKVKISLETTLQAGNFKYWKKKYTYLHKTKYFFIQFINL